ncbi:MAG: PilN domain-containing protein [Gammaproteobacteria bacterium]|nr:PilN domain-containing protein [Gammaproteobacteria bacterium]
MVNINLLPWRAQRDKEKQREFIVLLSISIGISLFICFIIHMVIASSLSNQLAVNDYLTQQINDVDAQIIQVKDIKQQKGDLIQRLFIIHELETSRVLLVEMFNNFANILPDGVYLTSIKKNKNLIIITGKARSNQQVSLLMENIDNSSSFANPVLTEIQDNSNNTTIATSVLDEIYSQGFELTMKEEFTQSTTGTGTSHLISTKTDTPSPNSSVDTGSGPTQPAPGGSS